MDYVALKTLIDSDAGNAARTDIEVRDWCNDPTGETRDKATISSPAIFATIMANRAEWQAMSADDRQLVRDILVIHGTEGVPTASGTSARAALIALLGNDTKAALAAQIPEQVSRAFNAGLDEVNIGDVQNARAL